jgi:hypothetical protein
MVPIPVDALPDEKDRIKDEPDPDVRMSQREIESMVEKNNEFYDDENDNDKNEGD